MNQFPLNSIPMNTSTVAYTLIPIPEWILIFNEQELCAFEEWVAALTTNKYDLPNFNLVSYKSPLIDNWGVVSHLISDRDLEFEVYIKGDDVVDFWDKVQAFKKKIVQQEGTLKLVIWSQTLFCKASVTEFTRTERDAPYASTFRLRFKSLESYNDWFQTQLSYINVLGNISAGITNEGHRETDLSIVMSFTTATALTDITITVNGFPITISNTFNSWDVLFIDSVTGIVQLNAVEIEYTWLLPALLTNPTLSWFNPVVFDFNAWSTVDVNIVMFYTKQFT